MKKEQNGNLSKIVIMENKGNFTFKHTQNMTPEIKHTSLFKSFSPETNFTSNVKIDKSNTLLNEKKNFKSKKHLVSYSPIKRNLFKSNIYTSFTTTYSLSKQKKNINNIKSRINSSVNKQSVKLQKNKIPKGKNVSLSVYTHVHSTNLILSKKYLTTSEIITLDKIKRIIFTLLSNSINQKWIIIEIEKIYKEALNMIKPHRRLSLNDSLHNNKVINKIEEVNRKCDAMQEERHININRINDKADSFADVKKSLNDFQEEINKIKNISPLSSFYTNEKKIQIKKKDNKCVKNISNSNNENNKGLSMKKASINLQLIKKVNGMDNSNKSTYRGIDNKKNRENIVNTHEEEIEKVKIKELNLKGLNEIKRKDFNDEFLENYNEFSPSWRKDVEEMNRRKEVC